MKKIFVFTLILLVILGLTGCTLKIYKLPWDHFCYLASDGSPIELELEEKNYIIDLLNKGKWYGGLAKCPADIKFATQSQSLGYCSEEGIFNDFTLQRSLVVTEKQRITINGYLGLNDISEKHLK